MPAITYKRVLHICLLKTLQNCFRVKEYIKIYKNTIVIVEKICYYNTCI